MIAFCSVLGKAFSDVLINFFCSITYALILLRRTILFGLRVDILLTSKSTFSLVLATRTMGLKAC